MSLTKHDTHTVYTITGPEWTCEWVVYYNKLIPIRNSCYLTNHMDPLNPIKPEKMLVIIPGLLDKVRTQVKQWILQGIVDANLLLLPENTPHLLQYAETVNIQSPW